MNIGDKVKILTLPDIKDWDAIRDKIGVVNKIGHFILITVPDENGNNIETPEGAEIWHCYPHELELVE